MPRLSPCTDCQTPCRGVRCNRCWGIATRGNASPSWKGGTKAKKARLYAKFGEKYRAYGRARYAAKREEILRDLRARFFQNSRNAYARRGLQPGAVFEYIDYAAIYERDAGVCGICSIEVSDTDRLSFDHIVPLSRGGDHVPSNVQVAHFHCNASKKAT